MTNLFLKVNKDLFKLGLNPTEILLLAQIMEFNTNTGDCFMSDKAFSEAFGVSESTISRELKVLEGKGFITRTTKNVKGGKERHITINNQKIEQALTNSKMKLDGDSQESNCCLSKVNLPVVKPQNDLIKDNIIDNKKDKINDLLPSGNKSGEALPSGKAANSQKEELEEISVNTLLAMGARYEITDNDLIRIVDTGKLFRIKQ